MAVVFELQVDALKKEFEECKSQDASKYELIDKLFARIDKLNSKLKDTELQLEKEKDLENLYYKKQNEFQQELRSLQATIAQKTFVSVLVDGDSMPFKDEFVKEDEAGGRRVAHMLLDSTKDYVKRKFSDISQATVILVRVYANTKGLSKAYEDTKVAPSCLGLEAFIRGFNMVDPFCDFVNAGTGKECSDEKLKEQFKLHIADVHCQHIIFGGSPDNGYARLLGPYSMNTKLAERITLLEGPPFARELAELTDKLHNVSFDRVFRTTKLATLGILPNNTPIVSPPAHFSYATALQQPSSIQEHLKSENATAPTATIPRNRLGQRIDDAAVIFPKVEYDELKNRKLCNEFYLRGTCAKGNFCEHPHDEDVTERQLKMLRQVSRTRSCNNGLWCDDMNCIFGHQCPRPWCQGENCWFGADMHGVDTVVV